MRTTYYIATQVKKSNGTLQWYNTKHFETEEQARPVYEEKMAKPNAVEVILWRMDHYNQDELIPRVASRCPDGFNSFSMVAVHCRIFSRI